MRTRDRQEARKSFEIAEKEFINWDHLTLMRFQDEILVLLDGKMGARTRLLYAGSLKAFVRIVGDRPLQTVNAYHVEYFMAHRLKEVRPVRVNIELRSLKALFSRAVLFKMIQHNPADV